MPELFPKSISGYFISKKDTFIFLVKNFVIFNIGQVLTIGVGAIIKAIFGSQGISRLSHCFRK